MALAQTEISAFQNTNYRFHIWEILLARNPILYYHIWIPSSLIQTTLLFSCRKNAYSFSTRAKTPTAGICTRGRLNWNGIRTGTIRKGIMFARVVRCGSRLWATIWNIWRFTQGTNHTSVYIVRGSSPSLNIWKNIGEFTAERWVS
jgi:hypothetical protein